MFARSHCGGTSTQSSIAPDATCFIAASLSMKQALARPCSVAHNIICTMHILPYCRSKFMLPFTYIHSLRNEKQPSANCACAILLIDGLDYLYSWSPASIYLTKSLTRASYSSRSYGSRHMPFVVTFCVWCLSPQGTQSGERIRSR